jgi:hypothetical protein
VLALAAERAVERVLGIAAADLAHFRALTICESSKSLPNQACARSLSLRGRPNQPGVPFNLMIHRAKYLPGQMRFCCRERVVDRGQRDLTFLAATVFAAADQLWTNSALRPDQYAQPVLALIALRQMEPSSRPSTPSWLPTTRGGSSQRRVTTKRAARSSSPRTRGSLGFCHYPAQRTSPLSRRDPPSPSRTR